MAGGGIKRGLSYGETDELGFHVVRDEVHVHDLQATILHLLGLDHEKLTYRFQGRDFRLTDVHEGRVLLRQRPQVEPGSVIFFSNRSISTCALAVMSKNTISSAPCAL